MNSKEKKIKNFDPNAPASGESGIFGLPFNLEEADLVIIPVPWEVTVSYKTGTAKGPSAIYDASFQVDLYDPFYPEGWKNGIYMIPVPEDVQLLSEKLRKKAAKVIEALGKGSLSPKQKEIQKEITRAGDKLARVIKADCLSLLDDGKLLIMVGGDHSTPLGFMKALAERHPSFGILQIDAHMDLRKSFEGFKYSHASIMYNALQIQQVSSLVQVGIRDFCEEEVNVAKDSEGKVITYFDRDLKERAFGGESWKSICEEIVKKLPEKVYISFDIDGLDPKLCPNTGTPVAGGFEVEQVLYLFRMIVEKGKKIIGIDLNEVAPGKDEWDANVGARLLFNLSNILLRSRIGTKPQRKK